MKYLKDILIQKAKDEYGDNIKPCGNHTDLYDSFTIHKNKLIFWFNIDSNTTKILFENMEVNNAK